MANINSLKKYHFIYKTSNLLNGEFYIGMHSTSNLKDGYMGSGTRIMRSIKKYGVENFKCEILEFVPDREKLALREKEIVNETVLKHPKCINLRVGGKGGNSDNAKKAFLEKLKDTDFKEKLHNTHSHSNKTKPRGWNKDKSLRCDWNGRNHSKDTIKKIKESKSGQGSGNSNSQFGSFWITNGCINKKIKQNSDIPIGWFKGRMG